MKRFLALFALLLILGAAQVAFAKPIVVWLWVDDAGKRHFTDNFNAIPEEFRARAVQGVYIPEKKLQNPGEKNGANKNNNRPKVTNNLDISEEQYFEQEGFLIIQAKVKNGYAQPVTNIKVKITFFDKQQNFIRSETTLLNPIQLQPGQEGRFKLEVPFTENINSYKTEFSWN